MNELLAAIVDGYVKAVKRWLRDDVSAAAFGTEASSRLRQLNLTGGFDASVSLAIHGSTGG